MKDYLAIFDLDGTLFDTSEVNYYAYKEALISLGIELNKEYFIEKCNGKHYTEFLPEIMQIKATTKNMELVHDIKKSVYAGNLDKARENKQLFNLIRLMRESYYLSIVTTGSQKNATDILNYFGYLELFDGIITQEDIQKVKPDPEGFFAAMDRYHIDIEHTIIFEDSDIGIRAARATGACVMVVNSF